MPSQNQQGFYTSDFMYNGHMDYDSVLLSIQKGNITTALNISTVQPSGQSDGSMFEINGNKLSFDLPTVIVQNKQYSFSISEPTSGSNVYNVTFSNLNYSVIGTDSLTTTGVIATDAATFQTEILATLAAYTPVLTFTISGNTATFLLTLTAQMGFDFLMQDTPLTETPPDVYAYTNPIVVKEAIDTSLAGLLLPIGGIDYLGDLFIFSTSAVNETVIFNIASTTNSGTEIEVIITGNVVSSIQVGSYVNIAGVSGGTEANGSWIVQSVTAVGGNTEIVLYGTTYVMAGTGGTVTTNINGYLAVTVNQKNFGSQVWTSIELLGTKAINSRFYHPIRKEINANRNNDITSIYFTDGYDFPRVFSYIGNYITNGAIEYYNPLGLYAYDGIGLSTKNIQNNPTPIVQPTSVSDIGGNIMSGNWRYAVIPLDASLTPSQVSVLSNPVNIYNSSFGNPGQIVGTIGQPSSMQVTVTVTDIPENVYSFIELIGINYVGSTETAYLIGTYPIPTDSTTMTITQTGLEEETPYTNGFVLNSLNYVAAGTQTVSSNTLLYGDLTAAQISDYTDFFQTLTHIPKRDTTYLHPTGSDIDGYTLGEYQIPIATAQETGYMLNETYRFWACVELINGGFTPLFWIDDIRFDAFVRNRANPFGKNRRSSNGITSYDLSESPESVKTQDINSYVFYVTFGNINPNFIIDGVPFYQLAKRIHIFRTDNNTTGLNEVLGCGLVVRHVGGHHDNGFYNILGVGGSPANYLFETPFLLSELTNANLPLVSVGANTYINLFSNPSSNWIYGIWGAGYVPDLINGSTPHSGSFYCPDWIYGQIDIGLQDGDLLFNYGQPDWFINVSGGGLPSGDMDSTTYNVQGTIGTKFLGTEFRLSGYTNVTNDPYDTNSTINPAHPINLPLDSVLPVSQFSQTPIPFVSGGVFFCPAFEGVEDTNSNIYTWTTPAHLWVYLADTPNIFTNNNSNGSPAFNIDIGMYYTQYYRNIKSVTASSNAASYPANTKFGAITQGTGIPTGSYIDIVGTSGISSVNVFGGDTFNQKSFLKIQIPNPDTNSNATSPEDTGGGVTAVFICQNRMNYNMRGSADGQYPNPTPTSNWVNDTTNSDYANEYDMGYTPRNIDNILSAYNPALPYITDYPERIIYSLVQPNGSVINNWRLFPPLNFYDLSSDKGKITNLTTLQGELYSLQIRELARQFYNERGQMEVNEASTSTQVALGSGTPFNKPGIPISPNIGNSNNLGLITGVGINGEDVLAWIDVTTRQVIIASPKGFEIVSLTKLMRSFFFNNLDFVTQDIPNIGNGITGVWDDKRKQFVWTVIAMNTKPEFDLFQDYSIGSIVTSGVQGFENYPAIYISTQNGNIGNPPSPTSIYWTLQPLTNNKYYQIYTIIYSTLTSKAEMQGGFTSFLTPTTYFYVQWSDTYLTAYPNTSYNGIYQDNVGNVGVWYINGGTSQTANGLLSFVTNEGDNMSKTWLGQYYTSNEIPYYLNYLTDLCASYTPNTQEDWMNLNGENYYNMIFNDINTAPSGTPYEDTTPVYGNYLITTITFQAYQSTNWVAQVVYKVSTKFKTLFRIPTK